MSVIGIDLDDVLAGFISKFVRLANARFGRPSVDTLPTDWEWSNMLPSKEEQALVWEDAKAIDNFWFKLPVAEGVSQKLMFELDKKHTVYFPTARVEFGQSVSTSKQSAAWLHYHFGIDFPTVIVAYEKGPMATALKYDYFLDDRPKNCLDIKKALPNCNVYLKDSSHNQTFDAAAAGLIRIKDFDEFATIILEGQ